ncbi:MAG: fumarylacetoacetate hydrolase family protein [Jannaschia sp.]
MPGPLFDLPPMPVLPVTGGDDTYPVGRVFCVGRNYAAHAAEMGNEVDREAPFYFTKSAFSVAQSGATIPYPPGTSDYHFEMELIFAIGAPAFRVGREAALAAVFGYGCGLDMTRRDLQAIAKDKRRPWDVGKDVEGSAILGPLTRAGTDDMGSRAIRLTVNDAVRQEAALSDMIHDVADIVVDLSRLYHLRPGDVVMTGTPAGVGAVVSGDVLVGSVDGLEDVRLMIAAPE